MARDPWLRIEGVKEVTETLKDVSPAEANRIAKRTVTRIARDVRDDVRARAPKGPTGNLRRAIKSRRTRGAQGQAEAEVWVDRSGGRSGRGYHWHLIEFGTVKMAAQPFTVPTIEAWRPKIPALYRNYWWPEYAKEMRKRGKR